MTRVLIIHKVDSIDELSQPICGATVTRQGVFGNHFVSVHEENVTCHRCLRLLDELKHKQDDGRLVF